DRGISNELVDGQRAASVVLIRDGLRPGDVEVGGGDDAHIGVIPERLQVLRRDDAESDYSDTVRLAHSIPLSMMVRTLVSRRTGRLCPGVATKTRPSPHCRVQTAGDVTGRCHGW